MAAQVILNRISVGRAVPPAEVEAEMRGMGSWALPAGFPIPFERESREIDEVIFCHLLDRFAQAKSIKKQKISSAYAAARDLADFDTYLRAVGRGWFEIEPEEVDTYLDAMASTISPVTLNEYAENTVARRENSVGQFYAWAFEQDLVADERFGKAYKRRAAALPNDKVFLHTDAHHLRLQRSSISRASGRPPTGPAPLRVDAWRALASALGPSKASEDDPRPTVFRLASECGLQIGLRIEEVCWLTVAQVLALTWDPSLPDNKTVILELRITKGGNKRSVHVPIWLVKLLISYIRGERAKNVRLAIDRRTIRYDHGYLFVNTEAKPEHTGKQLTPSTLRRHFTHAVREAGLARQETRTDPDTGEALDVDVPLHGFHDLRHTYAIWTYYERRRRGDPAPWVFIAKQLGHEDHKTTEKYYLACNHEFEAFITDHYMGAMR